jgi:hypothetical protein
MKKLFPWVIALSALAVSSSAAFYSIYGLGKMFAGATNQVMILAGSLEFAKLVTASLLYQYWEKLNGILKMYLLIATLVLILITSAGIYGFLSSAYQDTAFKVESQDKNVSMLDNNIESIKRATNTYQSQVDQKNSRVEKLTNIRINLQNTQDTLIRRSASTKGVRQQITDIDTEIKRLDSEVGVLNDSISSKNNSINIIEAKKLEISSDSDLAKEVGPLKYIAGLTGKPLDVVVNWYIIILMLVFDPLAIALVISANFAFASVKDEKDKKNTELPEPPATIPDPVIPDVSTEEVVVGIDNSFKIKEFNEPVDSPDIKINDIIKETITEENIIIADNTSIENKSKQNEYIEKGFVGYKANAIPIVPHIDPLMLR